MFTIRKATLADIEVIRTLAAQTFPATYQHILTPEGEEFLKELESAWDGLSDTVNHLRQNI